MRYSSSPFKPIFWQLLTKFGISLAIVGFGTSLMNYFSIRADLERQVSHRAESITQTLQLSSEGLIEVGYISMLERVATNFATLPDVDEVAIVAPDGKTITHNLVTAVNRPFAEIHPILADAVDKASSTGEIQSRKLKLNGKSVFVEISPFNNLMFGAGDQQGVAIAIISLKQMEQKARQAFLKSSITTGTGILIILVIMGLLIHKIITFPLSQLNKAVQDSQKSGKFSFEAGKINNEIIFLADTFSHVFNQLATYEELEKEVQQRKEVEIALRHSEQQEREKAEALQKAIQELKETQLHLIQTEKMSSLGQMVAGLAHEINNPVNFIHNNLFHANQYLKDLLRLTECYQAQLTEDSPEINKLLEEIEFDFIKEDAANLFKSLIHGSDRIRDLVLSLRDFSRLDQAEQKDVNIHDGIESTLLILQNRLDRSKSTRLDSIKIVRDYTDLPLVNCFASQINQVLMNLISNAIDALEEEQNAIISIHTEQLPNQWLRISIQDNGCGISEEICNRLFDPFFTTKPIGKGTGLGLSISYKIIVEQHQGKLYCNSTLGQGTTFVIEIPGEKTSS